MNQTYIHYITDNVVEITENNIGRPKLMKHEIVKTIRGYVITNIENKNSYFVSFPETGNSYDSLYSFLTDIKALDDRTPLTPTGLDGNYINQQLDNVGRVVLWIPHNKQENVKQNIDKMYYENVNPTTETLEELKEIFDKEVAKHIETTSSLSELEDRITELESKVDNK